MNSHSFVGLVSRQWDAVDWACVLYDRRIHKSPPFQRRLGLWEKPEVSGSQIWATGGLKNLGDVILCQKNLHESCRMGRRIVAMKLICSLGHCECDGHTVHKLSQRRLNADWLAPRESDCSRTPSKVSSDWLPSYIKATRTGSRDIQNGCILSGQPSHFIYSPEVRISLHRFSRKFTNPPAFLRRSSTPIFTKIHKPSCIFTEIFHTDFHENSQTLLHFYGDLLHRFSRKFTNPPAFLRRSSTPIFTKIHKPSYIFTEIYTDFHPNRPTAMEKDERKLVFTYYDLHDMF